MTILLTRAFLGHIDSSLHPRFRNALDFLEPENSNVRYLGPLLGGSWDVANAYSLAHNLSGEPA